MLTVTPWRTLGKWVSALALATVAHPALAAPMWQINPAGTGVADAEILSALGVSGAGFVQIVPDAVNPTTFVFVEHGAYRAVQTDGTTPFGSHDLTIVYSVTGSGSFLDPAALRFSSGLIDLYADAVFDFGTAAGHYGADNGTRVASFSIFDGGMSAGGLVEVSARAVSGSMLPGYFFNGGGTDMSRMSSVTMQLGIFNQTVQPDALMVAEIVCGLAAYAGPGCNGEPFANTPFAFMVQDGGYATIAAVPEPGTLSLLLAGLSLVGAAAARRHSARALV